MLSFDYDGLMQHNLTGVFSQQDALLRRQVNESLYTSDATLFDPETAVQGWDAISNAVTTLLARLPPGFAFHATGPAVGHHGAGRLCWRAGAPGSPSVLTGIDVAHVQDGRIKSLYVFIDLPSSTQSVISEQE